ncbi:hypothetical protein ABZ383_27480 [Streptomyces sp. NPDC005900]
MTESIEPVAVVEESGHPLYGLTVPLADYPRYGLTVPTDSGTDTKEDAK